MKPAIIVHGGAGSWRLDSPRLAEGVLACEKAVQQGQAILLNDGYALDAVEAAVHVLEDCPVLDAGIGSYLNQAGEVEMDAFIMDGATLDFGAVGAVKHVRHPITLARFVMSDTPHAFLVGAGANMLAKKLALPTHTDEAFQRGASDSAEIVTALTDPIVKLQSGPIGDTVGAVAIDSAGNIVAGTSTGGTRNKMMGRVGDTPIIGAGGYADNETAGVSATGHGEAIMRVLLSKQVADLVAQGTPVNEACRLAVANMGERVQGDGGVIAVDSAGNVGFAFNTLAMPYAYIAGNQSLVSGR